MRREDYCKTCGLFRPCPDCSRPQLSLAPAEPVYTEDQIREAFDAALWVKAEGESVTFDLLIDALKGDL